jgi:hypothetical protein
MRGRVRGWLLVPLVSVLVQLGTGTGASAHTGLVLTVNDDGHGSVAVDVLWADGHPVTEPVAGTMTAFSARGAQVGPAALTRLPDRPTVVYPGALPAGQWQVTVDLALPGIGHCEAPITVAANGTPHSKQCGTPSSAAPQAAQTAEPAGNGSVLGLAGAAAVIILATGAAIAISRRRRLPTPAARPRAR